MKLFSDIAFKNHMNYQKRKEKKNQVYGGWQRHWSRKYKETCKAWKQWYWM